MYKVKFFSGYEGKNFIGLSPEEVIKNMSDFEETFYGGKNKEIRRRYFKRYYSVLMTRKIKFVKQYSL